LSLLVLFAVSTVCGHTFSWFCAWCMHSSRI
jgi:hypothetical protein